MKLIAVLYEYERSAARSPITKLVTKCDATVTKLDRGMQMAGLPLTCYIRVLTNECGSVGDSPVDGRTVIKLFIELA